MLWCPKQFPPWRHRVTGTDFSYGFIALAVVIPRESGG